MNSIAGYILDLKKQIDLLLSKHKELISSNEKLTNERLELLNKLEYLEDEIKGLRKRVEVVDIAQVISVNNDESAGFARLKVNNLIRQVDKCIALLNE